MKFIFFVYNNLILNNKAVVTGSCLYNDPSTNVNTLLSIVNILGENANGAEQLAKIAYSNVILSNLSSFVSNIIGLNSLELPKITDVIHNR